MLGVLGVAGVLGYFCLTRSLQAGHLVVLLFFRALHPFICWSSKRNASFHQLLPPTTVAVLRAMEIIISYLIQARGICSTRISLHTKTFVSPTPTGAGDGRSSQQPRSQRFFAGRPQRACVCLGASNLIRICKGLTKQSRDQHSCSKSIYFGSW